MKRIAILSVITVIVAFACGTVPATAKSPEGVDLAELKGWNIVVADDAIASEIYAAEEFQERGYLLKSGRPYIWVCPFLGFRPLIFLIMC